MEKEQVKKLVQATSPGTAVAENVFTERQTAVFQSKYIDSYDEALELLEKHDITGGKGKHKWKHR
ncbi:hypothetical protein [Desulforamulus hydrothermalis]|uniref:Uncharacterized protein n=1 Tax=Desulforamulus hydrothermalis Lam5 = DSM 18033 TaxID=1121428 RepID=K8EH56_9FIRM|nr:hypothetical protein [Desulforamulus hydrothermalis]CCO07961.1 conserved hypothetical protein [Desulforamulus hydrothermalis Lam5 = DSM 18033]SHG85313.1 hypothetical protein SAMN02745177_00596 [Desulforamulus hydrothermalis Lam5 = DSM 18033]